MANYYDSLSELFWVSNNFIFHAYAKYRYYLISKNENKSLTENDLKKLGSIVIVSCLSTQIEESSKEQSKNNHQYFFEVSAEKEKNTRLSNLLGKSSNDCLNRYELLKEIKNDDSISKNIFNELNNLFDVLNGKFNPLYLCSSLKNSFEFIQSNDYILKYLNNLKKSCLQFNFNNYQIHLNH